MYTGMLYNTIVCFIIGLANLIAFWLLRGIRKKQKVKYSEGIDYFVLLLGTLWILVGIRIFFAYLERPDLDMFMWNWFTGPMTYLHLIPLFIYFGWSFFGNSKVRILFGGFFTLVILFTVFTLFRYGSTPGEVTFFGTKPVANDLTHKIFTFGIFFPIITCMIIDFIKRLRDWIKNKGSLEKQLFGFSSAALLYGLIAVFDGLALVKGWALFLVRIGIMVSALIFYLSASIDIEQ